MKIIFVCAGNTCRSPMAMGYLNSLNLKNVTATSAGLSFGGEKVSENAAFVMKEAGIDISSHISAPFLKSDFNADKIICMTEQISTALILSGADKSKVFVLGGGIFDPYGKDVNEYRRCRDLIFKSVNSILFDDLLNFSVTVAEEKDIPQIAEVEKECFDKPWSENALYESYKNRTEFAVAKSDGEVIGYIGLTCVLDEGYITNVAVKGKYRRQNIGSILLLKIFDIAKEKELSFVSLEVRDSNEKAKALYQKYGFVKEGVRKSFYEAPKEDAIIMTRRF